MPAWEHDEKTNSLVLHARDTNRSSMMSGSGVPCRAVRGPLDVARHPDLVRRVAGNFAADPEHAIRDQLRLARDDDVRAGFREALGIRHALLDEHRAVRPLRAALAEHSGVQVAGDVRRPPWQSPRARQQSAAVVPVAVRQHDGVDGAEVHAEDRRVVEERRAFRSCIEQQRAAFVADVGRDQQREPMMRTTDRLAGHRRQASRREESRPFGDDVLRRAGKAVGELSTSTSTSSRSTTRRSFIAVHYRRRSCGRSAFRRGIRTVRPIAGSRPSRASDHDATNERPVSKGDRR